MATVQYAGPALETMDQTAGAPLIVLFERDDAIAVPLVAQIRLAQYDVRAARTPVELFDILGKHDVALVLVDLGNATAGRREFWVALDGQRRGHPTQVMTFRYTPPGSIFDTDFEPSARAIADVEISGAAEFELILDGVRQRVPVAGGSAPRGPLGGAPGGASPFGGALGQGLGASPLGGRPQSTFAVPQGYYSPPPPPSDPFAVSPPYSPPGGFVVPAPHSIPAGNEPSPFAHPASVNPFAAGSEPSPFAHPASVNPFAAEMAPVAQPQPQPQTPAAAPRGGPNPQAGGVAADFEERAAHLSELYAAQFGLNGNPGAPRSSPSVADWGTPASPAALPVSPVSLVPPAPADLYGASGPFPAPRPLDFGASDSNARRAREMKEPFADAWTPPDGEAYPDLGGDTGVVPEMAYRPFSDPTAHMPRSAAAAWNAPAPAASASARAPDATLALEKTGPVPPSRLPAIQTQPAETALGTVLVEGALLSPERLAALKGIQRLLATVDMDFRLGELALMFQFLSPDQLLAALLVSRGLVSPQQIAGLGRVKQELAAGGMEHDLEQLLTMFHILPAEQIHALRAELGG